jgi:hypothetical protein
MVDQKWIDLKAKLLRSFWLPFSFADERLYPMQEKQ